ncbi:hypothetical protein B0I33_101484 [Prauserella shujinwangii]|uniref:DUF6286 domain-containing protein n=1 Tax=Prauserella shujinwangii TaxID=1453103 RepID=A0A2T0M3K0_9PSEU|nr:DUF6286 domain-containing protein [Prauserella shujinwangii]PRX51331.1 hypothetical protein B0I33_101484 [Prauserella shujinwangii]
MRILVRLLSTLLALAAAAAGALLALEVAWQWWRPGSAPLLVPWPAWQAALAGVRWDSTATRLAAALTALGGLLLVLAAAAARHRTVRLREPAPGVSGTLTPRALARLVGTHVRAREDVAAATVTASATRVRVRVTGARDAGAELAPDVTEAVSTVLSGLPLARTPRLSVAVEPSGERR